MNYRQIHFGGFLHISAFSVAFSNSGAYVLTQELSHLSRTKRFGNQPKLAGRRLLNHLQRQSSELNPDSNGLLSTEYH